MTLRSKTKTELGLTAVVVGLVCAALLPGRAWAQAATDVYHLNYYSNAHTRAPDATVHVVNPTAATLCANIYVFDANQNEQECCSCPITHNGLLTLSVNRNLTDNPVTAGTVLSNGVIKIVSSAQTTTSSGALVCSAGPVPPIPAPELRAWITHYPTVFPGIVGTLGGTEEEFARADLSADELDSYLAGACTTSSPVAATTGVCTCGANLP